MIVYRLYMSRENKSGFIIREHLGLFSSEEKAKEKADTMRYADHNFIVCRECVDEGIQTSHSWIV